MIMPCKLLDQQNNVAIKEQVHFLVNAVQRHRHSLCHAALLLPLLTVSTMAMTNAAGANPLAASGCDFNHDGFEDLALGVPGENVGGAANAGAVNVIYGSAAGLRATGNQLWHQNSPSVLGFAQSPF